jgi:hypothetical protein
MRHSLFRAITINHPARLRNPASQFQDTQSGFWKGIERKQYRCGDIIQNDHPRGSGRFGGQV